MKTRKMTCVKCDGTQFEVFWQFEDREAELRSYMCHDGFGHQFQDAFVKCIACGTITQPGGEDCYFEARVVV